MDRVTESDAFRQISLRFHGAVAVRTEMSDINGDGRLDLLVTFDQASVRLNL